MIAVVKHMVAAEVVNFRYKLRSESSADAKGWVNAIETEYMRPILAAEVSIDGSPCDSCQRLFTICLSSVTVNRDTPCAYHFGLQAKRRAENEKRLGAEKAKAEEAAKVQPTTHPSYCGEFTGLGTVCSQNESNLVDRSKQKRIAKLVRWRGDSVLRCPN